MHGSSPLECVSDQFDFVDSVLNFIVRIENKVFIHHKCFELTVVHVNLLLLVLLLHLLLLSVRLHMVGSDDILSEDLIHLVDHFCTHIFKIDLLRFASGDQISKEVKDLWEQINAVSII